MFTPETKLRLLNTTTYVYSTYTIDPTICNSLVKICNRQWFRCVGQRFFSKTSVNNYLSKLSAQHLYVAIQRMILIILCKYYRKYDGIYSNIIKLAFSSVIGLLADIAKRSMGLRLKAAHSCSSISPNVGSEIRSETEI